ncbi:MAG TPA: aspartyl/asparaginyl beta-hydroxylase domain-containing protein [Steroidobacteraceae bacterium]|nr:aspartyl/asparaginyl beta-hydroxylase domain-containing protein [Steroidobacteraceae bacterium]
MALDRKSIEEVLADAAALQAARRLDEAEQLHRAVLERAPANPASLQFLAARCFERGELSAAAAYMQRYVAVDPANLEACRALGVTLESLGRIDEAVAVLRQAYLRQTTEPITLLLLGAALAKAGHLEASAAAGSLLEATLPEMLQLDRQRGGAAYAKERSARLRHALEDFYAQVRADAIEEAKRAEPAADLSRVNGAVWRPVFAPGTPERRRPAFFYVPQLGDAPWLEPEIFDWADGLQAAAPELAQEVADFLNVDADGLPYIGKQEESELWRSLAGRTNWSAVHFWNDALANEPALARFPKVRAALERLPLVTSGGVPVEAFLSILKPRTRIPPHFGNANHRLTVHLPLIVPAGCGVEVGGEARETRFGRLMIFDDSYEHSAWNDSDTARIVLIFEIWHPALSAAERTAVAGMLSRYDRLSRRRHALLASGGPMPEKAEAELAARVRAVHKAPDDGESWLRLVECLVRQQRFEEAAQAASLGADKAADLRRLGARTDANPDLRELAVQADALIRQKLSGLHAEAIGPAASLRLRQFEWPPDDDGRLDLTTLSWEPALSRDEAEALRRSASARARWLQARRLPPVEIVVDRWGRPVREQVM